MAILTGCNDTSSPAPDPETIAESPHPASDATPDILPSVLKIQQQEKTYAITGIGLKGSNKVAIINNQVVKPGDEIDPGVYVKDVQPTYAIIVVGNKEHLLRPEDIQRELDRMKQ